MYEAGNEGQAKADRSSENERERIVLNKLVRRAVQCTILVPDLIEGNLNGGDRFGI